MSQIFDFELGSPAAIMSEKATKEYFSKIEAKLDNVLYCVSGNYAQLLIKFDLLVKAVYQLGTCLSTIERPLEITQMFATYLCGQHLCRS